MSKEYKAYRFFIMLYVVLVANFAILLAEDNSYYIWFASSIVPLLVLFIKERTKVLDFMKHPLKYKSTREIIFLVPFIVTYPNHYQLSRHLNTGYVILLQLINVLLFIILYCVEKKVIEAKSI